MKNWIAFHIILFSSLSAQADIYRWVDNNGKVVYSDQPPSANIKRADKIKSKGVKPGDVGLPYSLQQAVTNFPVTLFITPCGDPCTRGRELLAKRGIPYTEMDATVAAAQEELKKINGGRLEVPVLLVGRDTLKGFTEHSWNSALDAAGYPQTAVIPPRPPTKSAKPTQPSVESAPSSPPTETSQ